MLNIPNLARGFAAALLFLGLYLAIENTMITAEVLADKSGASVVASASFALVATGVELVFASWVRTANGFKSIAKGLVQHPVKWLSQLFVVGFGLALVYHFDIMTTAQHPRFNPEALYFFAVVVFGFVFGPEASICIGGWLWFKARDIESRKMVTDNWKDAENQRLRTERESLIRIAKQVGQDDAIAKARNKWSDRIAAQ